MKISLFICCLFVSLISIGQNTKNRFNMQQDLLLMHFDCKTDVDDVHSAAALAMLMAAPDYQDIFYHAVAGTYGIQEGLYVPPEELFEKAFEENWSDAHGAHEKALDEVSELVSETLQNGGNIWVADAGQSDFTAELVTRISAQMPGIKLKDRIHVVQHADWNEEVTSPEALAYVRFRTTYYKIPDGNTEGNGTPGFRTPGFDGWKDLVEDPEIRELWELAVDIGNRYNGKEGRYMNEAVAAGGLDFSDMAEVCWILGIDEIRDAEEFYERFCRHE
jgi:hypothetical protein